MQVKQIYDLVNGATKEILGESAVVQEDLSNLADVGTAIFDSQKVDNFVHSLVDRIGKVVVADRAYTSSAPSVLRDGWEFGSVIQKISDKSLPDADETDSWKLVDGQDYPITEYNEPDVEVRYFNDKVTFTVKISIADVQVKEAFTSRDDMNRFLSLIFNTIRKTIAVKTDALVNRTIGNAILSCVKYDNDATGDDKNVIAVNLLKLYNDTIQPSTTLTASKCLYDLDFLKFATNQMLQYPNRLKHMNTVYNRFHFPRFTPENMLHFILLDKFATASDTYLQSSTYHNELVKLKGYETVPYWQGSGKNYSFEECSKLHAKINYVSRNATTGVETKTTPVVSIQGVIGVMFDHDALAVANYDERITSTYVPSGEFTNYWFKVDGHYMEDAQEQMVVFYVADATQGE